MCFTCGLKGEHISFTLAAGSRPPGWLLTPGAPLTTNIIQADIYTSAYCKQIFSNRVTPIYWKECDQRPRDSGLTQLCNWVIIISESWYYVTTGRMPQTWWQHRMPRMRAERTLYCISSGWLYKNYIWATLSYLTMSHDADIYQTLSSPW